MTCRFCGSPLPEGAMFCGECGRATGQAAVAELEFGSAAPRADPDPGEPGADAVTCPQCAEPIDPDDVFCGECGFLLRLVPPPPGARDTAVIDPAESDLGLEVEAAADPGADLESDAEPESERVREPDPVPESSSRPAPDPFPWGASPHPAIDLESTRVVGSPPPGKRFVLQFSTGDSVIVSGAGLVGRNPAAEPGEFFDQLVTIFDASKSVSKTHLEFGQEGGRFWVCDRFSTNGSMVRQPDLAAKRCEPGRRYFVARGSRVDIGDQFFVVS